MPATALILSLLLTQPALQDTKPVDKREIIKATHILKGKFVGFEVGDYVHAIVKDSKGKERSFFIGEPGLDFYLALNAKKNGSFTYQVVDAYIEEAGGRMVIERMSLAKVGRTSSYAWWKSTTKKSNLDAINKKYQPLVDKLTRNP
jgi:hypothetical protein